MEEIESKNGIVGCDSILQTVDDGEYGDAKVNGRVDPRQCGPVFNEVAKARSYVQDGKHALFSRFAL